MKNNLNAYVTMELNWIEFPTALLVNALKFLCHDSYKLKWISVCTKNFVVSGMRKNCMATDNISDVTVQKLYSYWGIYSILYIS